jgi:hypothetical protein
VTGPRPWAVADYVRRTGEPLALPEATWPPSPQPRPYLAPGTPEAYREFARCITGLHQITPHHPGQMPMCSCGSVARICPVINAAHELLGEPVPWQPGDQPPPMPDRPPTTWTPL